MNSDISINVDMDCVKWNGLAMLNGSASFWFKYLYTDPYVRVDSLSKGTCPFPFCAHWSERKWLHISVS